MIDTPPARLWDVERHCEIGVTACPACGGELQDTTVNITGEVDEITRCVDCSWAVLRQVKTRKGLYPTTSRIVTAVEGAILPQGGHSGADAFAFIGAASRRIDLVCVRYCLTPEPDSECRDGTVSVYVHHDQLGPSGWRTSTANAYLETKSGVILALYTSAEPMTAQDISDASGMNTAKVWACLRRIERAKVALVEKAGVVWKPPGRIMQQWILSPAGLLWGEWLINQLEQRNDEQKGTPRATTAA